MAITATRGIRTRLGRLLPAAWLAAARCGGRRGVLRLLSRWGGALAWALAAAAAPSALAADLNLLATSSVNAVGGTAGETDFSQESFITSLDANYNRSVTSLLGYRLRLLASGDESRLSAGDSSVRSSSWFVQPEGDMTLSGPRYSLNLGGKLRESWLQNSQSGSRTQNEDYEFIRAFITPELLPSLNMQLERNAQSDDEDPQALDRERTRAVATLGYGLLGQRLLLGYTFTREAEDDDVTRQNRELLSHVGTVGFTDSYFDNRLSVNANYLVNWVQTTEEFSASTVGGVTVAPVVISGAFALTETNPTVAAASKVPPATYTTLTTTASTTLAITAPLVVDQGGTPGLNQSIALGLTPGTSITTIRLTVASRPGDPRDITLQAQGVTFQVFVGTNPGVNLTAWSAVPVVSVLPPTTVNPYFEITIGATGGTFVKVHVAGDTQQPVLPPLTATAVTVLTPAAAGGGSTQVQTRNLLQFVNASLTGTPIRDLTLGANASFSFNEQDPAGRRDTSGNYSFTASGTPHRLLTVIGTYQGGLTSSDDPQTQETLSHNGTVTLTSSPLPTLTSALSGNWSQTELEGERQNQVVNVSFNNALVPYRNLNVDFTLSGSEGRSFVDDTRSRVFSFNLNANTTLTPRLTALFTYTLSSGEITRPLTADSFTSNSGFLSLTYTVSRFLDVNGRWDITVTDRTQVLTQAYRLNLRPTEKTSLILAYLRTDQWGEGIGGSTNAISANATWSISRYFDLSALGSFTLTPSGDNVYTVSSTLSFRL